MDKKLSEHERKTQVVAMAATELGEAEKALEVAATAFTNLIAHAEAAYVEGILTGTECTTIKGKLRRFCGAVGAIEEEVYPFHAEMTGIAKAQKIDVPIEYATLKGKKPTTKSGGGR